MYEYTKILKNNYHLKQKGDKLILDLFDQGNNSKYTLLGKHIILSTEDKLDQDYVEKTNLLPAKETTSNETDLYSEIKNIIVDLEKPNSFAISVNRKGEHKYNSTELARNLAAAVFEKWENIKVNLGEPELLINIQIINNKSIIYIKQK